VTTTDTTRACAPNLRPTGRRLRLALGVLALAAGALMAASLAALDAEVGWRLAVVVPFAAGLAGVMQARAGT
jgi:hypothetical protein